MQQHQLKPRAGSRHRKTRRGIGDTFAGGGAKGQQARVGKSKYIRAGFEGGQTPIHRRMPKLGGFININRIAYQAVNLDDLAKVKSEKITPEDLKKVHLIRSVRQPVKLLGGGELARKITISVHAASSSAKAAVEKSGGTINILAAKRAVPAKKPYEKK